MIDDLYNASLSNISHYMNHPRYVYISRWPGTVSITYCVKLDIWKSTLDEMYDLHYMADEVFSAGN